MLATWKAEPLFLHSNARTMKRTFGTAIYHSMRTSWRYGSLGGCPLLARLPRPVRDLKVEPRDLAEVAIDNVEKSGEVGQDCQIRGLESCSSQVRSGQVRSGWREEGGISPWLLSIKWMISSSRS